MGVVGSGNKWEDFGACRLQGTVLVTRCARGQRVHTKAPIQYYEYMKAAFSAHSPNKRLILSPLCVLRMLSASIGETSKMVNLSFCLSSSLSLPVPFVKIPFVVVGSPRSCVTEVGVIPGGMSGLSARECGREVERDCEKGVGEMRRIK